jgi:hypothetical protein
MSDGEVDADLHLANRELHAPVSASRVLEAIVAGGWNQLDAGERADVDTVLSMGDAIDLSPGSRARVLLTTAFAGHPATLEALETVGRQMTCRAAELNCLSTPAIVAAARAIE